MRESGKAARKTQLQFGYDSKERQTIEQLCKIEEPFDDDEEVNYENFKVN